MQTAIAEAADGYSIPSGTTQTINEHGICRRVTNAIAGGHGLFVPTRYLMEWANNPVAFLSNTIPGVSLAECLNAVSLRFKRGSSAFLSFTPASNGNRRTFTWSAWVKRGAAMGTTHQLFTAFPNANSFTQIAISSDNVLQYYNQVANTDRGYLASTGALRDPAAWYHVVVSVDATAGFGRIYVNGVDQTVTHIAIGNYDSSFNASGVGQRLGVRADGGGTGYFDGYLADVHLVDGLALPPTAFAENDAVTNQWVPKAYSGAYGTTGYRLDFGTVANLGADKSGNNNNWTPSNFSTTNGPTYDPMRDASHPSGQDYGPGNFATLNPLSGVNGPTFLDGNLAVTFPTGTNARAMGTQAVDVSDPAGYYWEFTLGTNAATHGNGGFVTEEASLLPNGYYSAGAYVLSSDGSFYGNAGLVMGGLATQTTNDVVGFGIRSGNVYLYKNGVVMNSGNPVVTGLTGRIYPALFRASSTGAPSFVFNAGQRPFHAGLPVGFKALNTHSLPAPAVVTPSAYFRTVTYTGNGSYQQVGVPPARTGGATINHSLRFRTPAETRLLRQVSAGNRRTFTYATWVKRGNVSTGFAQTLLQSRAGSGTGADFSINLTSNDVIQLAEWDGASYGMRYETNAQYRNGDWMHLVVAIDTTQATPGERQRLYVDGKRIHSFSIATNYTSQNYDSSMNVNGFYKLIGCYSSSTWLGCLDGYLADTHFIDGQALGPDAFGQENASGVWVPKAYSGGYGTNGFRLAYSNAAAPGTDSSGNGNTFSYANLVATDQVADTPTRAFQTWNPLDRNASMGLSTGNLTTVPGGAQISVRGRMAVSKGKWYWEMTQIGSVAGNHPIIGVADAFHPLNVYPGNNGSGNGWSYYGWNGNKFHNTAGTAYGVTFAQNDTIGVALDMDDGKIWFSKNGVWMASGNPAAGTNAAFTNLAGHTVMPIVGNGTPAPGNAEWNFGQGGRAGLTYYPAAGGSFLYAPPTGFKAMSTEHISTTDFVPDLAIIKSRSAATDWAWYDRERGATLDIASNLTSAETVQSGGLLGFNAGGFNVGNLAKVNTSGANYIAYLFKKGVTPGFDIVRFAKAASSNQSFNHSLGVAPSMIVFKGLTNAGSWQVWHRGYSTPTTGVTYLNLTNAEANAAGNWNSTLPTSTQFTMGTTWGANDYVAYLFSEVPGFSKFGRYIGNGSADGAFVHTGFKPAFVMMKRIDSTENWAIKDGARQGYNPRNDSLYPNLTNAELDDSQLDLLSNGFKLRNTNTGGNVNGATYIYAAFAESPFKHSNAR